jgi:hypothetical protein
LSLEWNQLDPEVRARIESFQDSAPVRLPELAKALGVSVKAATLAPGISGEIRPTDGGYVIRINRHDHPKRQRFTVAHELAHYLLHKDDIGTGIEDDVLYRSSLSDKREQQANRLAADILMPQNLIAEAREAAEEKGIGELALYLSDVFGVSEAAMRIRTGL